MKICLLSIALLLSVPGFLNSKKNDRIFLQLHALEGKWIMKTKKGAVGESWKILNKDLLQNSGYMIRGSDTIITERVALRNTKEGIFYVSTVEDQNNQAPVSFRLTSGDNNMFVFENPAHDFPKKITYHFVNKDSLEAWIDDGKKVPEKKSMFRYSRQN